MASFIPPKKNDANGFTFYTSLAPQTADGTWQANPTLASGDFKVALDDGAPANLGTLPVVDADFTKRVKIVLSQAETNADNITIIASDQAGAEWCDATWNIQTAAQTFDETDAIIDSILVDTGTTLQAELDGIQADTEDIQTRLPAALVSGRIDASVGAMAADVLTAAATAADFGAEVADAVWDEDATGHQTQGTFGQAIGDPGADTDTIYALANSIKSDSAAILVDTAEIGAAGVGLTEAGGTGDHLTAITWNAAWDAEVQSEVTDALNAYDPPTNTEMVAAFTEIKGATWATTDTLEAIRDRGDAAWITATGFSTLDAAGVRTAVGLASADLDTQLAALPTANENADALLDRTDGVETGLTPRGAMRLNTAVLAGKMSGGGTGTETFRNAVADSKDRLVSTNDSDGNRSAITTDVT